MSEQKTCYANIQYQENGHMVSRRVEATSHLERLIIKLRRKKIHYRYWFTSGIYYESNYRKAETD